jgi:hypothetical protein
MILKTTFSVAREYRQNLLKTSPKLREKKLMAISNSFSKKKRNLDL